jgi:alkanesulfonate monooxygenase SsuD/methylene tetrahydromethanopterin reductase-like flavin-dependent oxidoreductase (luciferase family)
VHDGVFFEDNGMPTATVISTEFAKAARAQAGALGADTYKTIMVQHPIQPLTRDEVRALADKAFDEIVARLQRKLAAANARHQANNPAPERLADLGVIEGRLLGVEQPDVVEERGLLENGVVGVRLVPVGHLVVPGARRHERG